MNTLPNVTPPIGKIHSLRKIAVTFELMMHFDILLELDISRPGGVVNTGFKRCDIPNKSLYYFTVCRAAPDTQG